MSTIFGIIVGAVGLWYLHRYMKNDFMTSVEQKPVNKPASVKASVKKPAVVKKGPATTKDKVASKPVAKTTSKPDDFKRLNGIGPKIANLLKDKGILTYQQLSAMDAKQLFDFLQKEGVRVRQSDPASWKKQANLAAEGKWDEIKKLQQTQSGKRNGNVANAA